MSQYEVISSSDPQVIPGDPNAPEIEGRSLGDLVGQLTRDLSRLVSQEITLAKTELKEDAAKAGKGAGLLGGAGVAGNLFLVFISLAAMFALGEFMSLGWAALIVAVVWAIVAAVLASSGRKQLKNASPPLEQTTESLKEDARWAKQQSS